MIVVTNYALAVLLCILAMLCWGSWQNTRNVIGLSWRFELYYWDFIFGILLFSLIAAFTIGSLGAEGRSSLTDLKQADGDSLLSAMLGGVIWNLGTLLLVAAIAIAGMSVAFPIGGGIGWLLGIIVNYDPEKINNPAILFTGIVVIMGAILFSMRSYQKLSTKIKKPTFKGIGLSFSAGILIAFFYKFVMNSLAGDVDPGLAIELEAGKISPYTASVMFSLGAFLSTFIYNPIFMKKPVEGSAVSIKDYLQGGSKAHFWGIIGGFIWCTGMIVSYMSAQVASPAVSYGLSNAAPVAAALWGIFVWKEFKAAPAGTNKLLVAMFACYLIGLALITYSNI